MSDADRCPTCREWLFSFERRDHTCKPEWLASDADDGPWDPADASTVRGRDAEEAAEAFAEKCDDEGDVIRAGSIDVFVAPVDKPNEVERWRVTAEAVVNYSAGRLESQEKT